MPGPRIFQPTLRWTEQLTHSIISRPEDTQRPAAQVAQDGLSPGRKINEPHTYAICHTDVVAMMKINAVVGYT